MLAFPPKRLGVDAPDGGLDPVFPLNKLGCGAPVVPDPNIGLAPAVVPPPNRLPAGFDVAGVDWPKIELVAGVPLVPKSPPWLGPEVPLPPAFPKLNVFDILCRLR